MVHLAWMASYMICMPHLVFHPLRLSLCEIEYKSESQLLSVQLKLFLTDVNEALTFDPYSKELAFCEPHESVDAERLLIDYLCTFFYVKANDIEMPLEIRGKQLSGTGDNTALWVYFEFPSPAPLTSLEIKNAVFTDLFFDQSNLIYAYIDGNPKSLMLNKDTPSHLLTF